jgi:hypothetical protein
MLLPLAGALLVGLPGLLLGIWFSWLVRRCWLCGGVTLVVGMWFLCVATVAAGLSAIGAPFIKTDSGLPYNALVCFCVLGVAGGIPSAVIAIVVSCLTHGLEGRRGENKLSASLIVGVGAVAGILAGVPALRLSMSAMDVLWGR